jgi:hypothetical protein
MPTDLVRGLKAHGTSPAKTKLFGRFPFLFGRKSFPGRPCAVRERGYNAARRVSTDGRCWATGLPNTAPDFLLGPTA